MKKIFGVFGLSVVSQGLNALAGLLLARWLSINEYSIYTIIITASVAMTSLSKGGVSLGLNSMLGKTWPDMVRGRDALKAANFERSCIAFFILPILLPTTFWLLSKSSSPAWLSFLFSFLLIIQWLIESETKNSENIILFAEKSAKIQLLDSILGIFRSLVIVVLYLLGAMSAISAFIVNIVVAGLRIQPIHNWREGVLGHAEKKAIVDADLKEVRAVTRRQLPLDIFFVFQLQIIFIIISWSGSNSNTAELGAMSRIGQLLTPFTMVTTLYAIPRFSKTRDRILTKLTGWLLLTTIPGLILVLFSALYPEVLLLLIGPKYMGLKTELVIFCIGVFFSTAVTSGVQLASNRGWNQYGYIQIPIVLVLVTVSAVVFDLSIFINVLWLLAVMPLGQAIGLLSDLYFAKRRNEY